MSELAVMPRHAISTRSTVIMVVLVAPLLLVSTMLGHMAQSMPAAAGDSATEPADYTTARRTGSGGPRQGHHDLSAGIEWVTTCHQQGWWSLLLISRYVRNRRRKILL